MVPIFVTFSF